MPKIEVVRWVSERQSQESRFSLIGNIINQRYYHFGTNEIRSMIHPVLSKCSYQRWAVAPVNNSTMWRNVIKQTSTGTIIVRSSCRKLSRCYITYACIRVPILPNLQIVGVSFIVKRYRYTNTNSFVVVQLSNFIQHTSTSDSNIDNQFSNNASRNVHREITSCVFQWAFCIAFKSFFFGVDMTQCQPQNIEKKRFVSRSYWANSPGGHSTNM